MQLNMSLIVLRILQILSVFSVFIGFYAMAQNENRSEPYDSLASVEDVLSTGWHSLQYHMVQLSNLQDEYYLTFNGPVELVASEGVEVEIVYLSDNRYGVFIRLSHDEELSDKVVMLTGLGVFENEKNGTTCYLNFNKKAFSRAEAYKIKSNSSDISQDDLMFKYTSPYKYLYGPLWSTYDSGIIEIYMAGGKGKANEKKKKKAASGANTLDSDTWAKKKDGNLKLVKKFEFKKMEGGHLSADIDFKRPSGISDKAWQEIAAGLITGLTESLPEILAALQLKTEEDDEDDVEGGSPPATCHSHSEVRYHQRDGDDDDSDDPSASGGPPQIRVTIPVHLGE